MRNYTRTTEDGLIRPFIRLLPAADRNTVDAFDCESDKSYYTIYDDEYDKLRELGPDILKTLGLSQETLRKIFTNLSSFTESNSSILNIQPAPTDTLPVPHIESSPSPAPCTNAEQRVDILPKAAPRQEIPPAAYMPRQLAQTRVTAINTANSLRARTPMFVLNEELYVYNSTYYVKQSQENAEKLIRLLCEDDCAAVGRPEFATSVYKSLLQDPRLSITEKELQNHFIAFEDGQLLNLTTNVLQPALPSIRTTYSLKCRAPVAGLPSPCFTQVMQNITRGDQVLHQRFLEVLGYLFSGDTRGKCIFLFQGVSNSGKSMLIKMLLHCFDKNQRLTMDLRAMSDKFAVANLREVRLNVCHDMPADALSTDIVRFIKTITGDEELTSDQKYKSAIHFKHSTRLVMASNYAIRTKNPHDFALLEARTVTLPFAYSVPREQWDHELTDKLIAELPSIVAQALQAYYRLVRNHYIFSGEYSMNTIISPLAPEASIGMDTLLYEFVRTHISPAPDAVLHLEDARVYFNRLYSVETSAAQFSPLFKQLAISMHSAVAAKVRREGIGNPISSLRHVMLVE